MLRCFCGHVVRGVDEDQVIRRRICDSMSENIPLQELTLGACPSHKPIKLETTWEGSICARCYSHLSRRRGGIHRSAAIANDELIKLSQNPKEWGCRPATRQSAITRNSIRSPSQCRQVAGGLDVLDRGAARARRRTVDRRQHDVRSHAVPNKVYALDLANENRSSGSMSRPRIPTSSR